MIRNLKYTLITQTPVAWLCVLGVSLFKGFSPELLPKPNDFKGLNNSEVTLSASIVQRASNDLHLSTSDRDIKLKRRAMDTPTGGDTWV
jgi:hypothetical protein